MIVEDKIVVTMTTYKKRINGIDDVVKSILSNTVVPHKIVCNLSSDEFPLKEEELPERLVKLQDNGIFEIFWVKENVRQFKKLIPTLERFPNDVIISIDDDFIYEKDFIEKIYSEYLKNRKECPITSGSYRWPNNVFSHYGAGVLVTAEMFGNYLFDLYYNFAKEIILKNEIRVFDDPLYTYAMLLSGKRYKYVKIHIGREIKSNDSITHAGEPVYRKNIFAWHDMIKEYIKEKYGKTYDDMLAAPVNVNFTTWKKRETAVPIMIKTITKQSRKPDRVIVFLSKDEYNNETPNVIKELYKNGDITDIEWVDGNIYSHKRWETIKKYNNCYNIFIDDDIYYDLKYVEELYDKAIKNQGCEVVWTTQVEEINGSKRSHPKGVDLEKSKKFQTLSGMACFPPYTYPLEAFEHAKDRDKWCIKCDDSWNRAWLIKNDIEIVRVHDRHQVGWRCVPETDKDGIWAENKQYVNGVENMVKNFANAIVCAKAVEKAKNLWPNFDIYKCCSSDLLLEKGIMTAEEIEELKKKDEQRNKTITIGKEVSKLKRLVVFPEISEEITITEDNHGKVVETAKEIKENFKKKEKKTDTELKNIIAEKDSSNEGKKKIQLIAKEIVSRRKKNLEDIRNNKKQDDVKKTQSIDNKMVTTNNVWEKETITTEDKKQEEINGQIVYIESMYNFEPNNIKTKKTYKQDIETPINSEGEVIDLGYTTVIV